MRHSSNAVPKGKGIRMKLRMTNGEMKEHRGRVSAEGEVTFRHPQDEEYEVISPDLSKTMAWLKNYYAKVQAPQPGRSTKLLIRRSSDSSS